MTEKKIYELPPLPEERIELQESLTNLVEFFERIDLIGRMSGQPDLSLGLFIKLSHLLFSALRVANPAACQFSEKKDT